MNSSLDLLTLSNFVQAIETQFEVQTHSGLRVVMKLSSATPGNVSTGGPDGSRFESFSLIFHGPSTPVLGQGTYSFMNERFGKFELFIVPIGGRSAGVDYQAIFNRQIKEG